MSQVRNQIHIHPVHLFHPGSKAFQARMERMNWNWRMRPRACPCGGDDCGSVGAWSVPGGPPVAWCSWGFVVRLSLIAKRFSVPLAEFPWLGALHLALRATSAVPMRSYPPFALPRSDGGDDHPLDLVMDQPAGAPLRRLQWSLLRDPL